MVNDHLKLINEHQKSGCTSQSLELISLKLLVHGRNWITSYNNEETVFKIDWLIRCELTFN